jgi:hypothetical protein
MQKFDGSSPFIRFSKAPLRRDVRRKEEANDEVSTEDARDVAKAHA